MQRAQAEPTVTLHKHGMLALGGAAFAALREPSAVELRFDSDSRTIALRAVNPDTANCQFVHRASPQPSGPFLISAKTFLRSFDTRLPPMLRLPGTNRCQCAPYQPGECISADPQLTDPLNTEWQTHDEDQPRNSASPTHRSNARCHVVNQTPGTPRRRTRVNPLITTHDVSRPDPSAEQHQPADPTPHEPPPPSPRAMGEERVDDEEWAMHARGLLADVGVVDGVE